MLSFSGSMAYVPYHLSFLCFEILSGPHWDIFLSQSAPCNGFQNTGKEMETRGRRYFYIIAVYFCGKSLVGKTCIWGTFKGWHFNPWLQSLELPFAWWHLKLDHRRLPDCQTAATLARANSREKGRGYLLKGTNKCLPRLPYQPKQAAAFKRFLLSCRARKGELFQERPEKKVLECLWGEKKNLLTYFLKENDKVQLEDKNSTSCSPPFYLLFSSLTAEHIQLIRICEVYPNWADCGGLPTVWLPFKQGHFFPSVSCPRFSLDYDKPWCWERRRVKLFFLNFFLVPYT